MLRVASCLTQEHDLRLVALAVLVWLLAAGIGVRLLDDRDVEAGRRLRVGAAVVVSGAGVWAAQLVSTLAFRPAVPFEFDVSPGVLAGIISIGATGLAFSIWPSVRGSLGRVAASGVALAAGIVASHLAGMVALQGLGVLQVDLAVASFALTAVCSVGAMGLLARRQAVWGSVALMAGVLPGHVVAMGSLTFAGSTDAGPVLMSALAPALAIGGTGLVVMALAVATVAIERQFTLRLTRETRRFGVLADATLDGLIFERHGQIVGVNRVICELAKTEAGALIGRPVSELISGIDFRLSERGAPVERALQLRDGQSVLVDVSWTNGPDAGGRVLAVRDLSAVKAAEREIERLAHLDPLTGLANREVFEQALDQARVIAAQKGTGFAVLYADLDRFGLLIEALGHREAEQVLIQTAGRLSALVAGSGTVARLGRDAFAIIQPLVAHVRDPAVVAEAVLTDMAAPFAVDGHPIAITASIGLAVYPDDGTDPRNLLECAILAVCQAKREGRGRQCRFQPNMDLLLQEKRLLAQDLRIALQENQFSLDYQPFVDTVTLETVGYEALLRWDHPERGRIAPVDFIPLAEESGLIVPIGSWVLATACAEAAAWDDQTIISVNLSPAQFVQPGIVRYSGGRVATDRPAVQPVGTGDYRKHADGRHAERAADSCGIEGAWGQDRDG